MSVPLIQPSFAGGELAPSMYGRVDVDKYHVGLSTCRNMFVGMRGGAYSRAGTAFVGFSKQTGAGAPPRLITFQFNINQGLSLEFGNLYMRVISNGAFVLEAAQALTGATQANPGVFTIPGHGFANGDWVFGAGITGMTQLNGRELVVAGATMNTFTLKDVFGNVIDTSALPAWGGAGTFARIYTLVTPYAQADLPYLKFTQSADVMSLTCWNQVTGTTYAPRDLSRIANNNWTLTVFSAAALIAAPGGVTSSAQSSQIASTYYGYVVTAIDRATGQESEASAATVVFNNDIAINSGSNTIGWTAVAGASSYNVYKAPPSYGSFPAAGTAYGYMTTSLGQNAIDTNIVPDFAIVPPVHADPFAIGAITDVPPTAGGANYSQQTIGYAITTGTGSGFVGTPVVVDGQFAGFVIENPGKDYLPGDTIALTDSGGGVATGNYAVTSNAADGDSIVINGVTLKFRRSSAAPAYHEFPLGNTIALTLQNLANYLNSQGDDASFTSAVYTADATHLYVTYKTPGAVGNAFTLGAAPTGWTASGGNLTGGGTVGAGATATLTIGPQTGTFPSVVGYFQQRRVYAGSPNFPDTYWMSQPGAFQNFDARIPTVDTDAITGSPWSVQVNGIQFMLPMPGGLVVLTGLQAWQLTGSGGSSLNPQPITPAGQQAQPQAYNGCSSRVPPIRIDYDINYIQAKGSLFRDLSYNFWTNIYTGTDLTYLSPHLFNGYQVLEMAWCEEPFRLVWATRNDGALLSLTYFKQQDVMGWARHDTCGFYWSICSVTEPPVDALYLASERVTPAGDCYMIERMDNRFWPANENTWCVDAGLTTTLATPNATLSASSATGPGTPTGVSGLVGGANYSAGTTVTVADPTGAGAVATPTIVGGVITAIGFAGGTGYTRPQLVIVDPAGTGAGASATVVLNNVATFTASSAVFSAPMVGQVIRMGGGRAVITAYTSTTQVSANIVVPITQVIPNSGGTPAPAAAGAWSVAPNLNTIGGLWHLVGMTVTGVADGAPIAPQVVNASGQIVLATAASLVTLGLGFLPQFQTLYLDSGNPTIQGQRGKVAAVTLRLEASGIAGIQTGVSQPDGSAQSPPQIEIAWGVKPAPALATFALQPGQNQPPYGLTTPPLFTGDGRVVVSGGFTKPKQIAVQQNSPLPLQILAVIPELLPGNTPEEKSPTKADEGDSRKAPLWGPQRRAA